MKKAGYVYTLSKKGLVFYVGSTVDFVGRRFAHKYWYGSNTEMESIEEVSTSKEDLVKAEIFCI